MKHLTRTIAVLAMLINSNASAFPLFDKFTYFSTEAEANAFCSDSASGIICISIQDHGAQGWRVTYQSIGPSPGDLGPGDGN